MYSKVTMNVDDEDVRLDNDEGNLFGICHVSLSISPPQINASTQRKYSIDLNARYEMQGSSYLNARGPDSMMQGRK